MKKIDIFATIVFILATLVIISIGVLAFLEMREMIIDHECYLMENEQFFKEEKCKPYWRYRDGLK